MYKKTTQTAFAAMSALAEVYDGGTARLSAAEIAKGRKLQPAFLSKILTTLARAGLVDASRGPGGGFTLTRHPKKIVLHDVMRLFERASDGDACPFGGGTCGRGKKCPLHDRFAPVRQEIDDILHETSFEEFRHRPS